VISPERDIVDSHESSSIDNNQNPLFGYIDDSLYISDEEDLFEKFNRKVNYFGKIIRMKTGDFATRSKKYATITKDKLASKFDIQSQDVLAADSFSTTQLQRNSRINRKIITLTTISVISCVLVLVLLLALLPPGFIGTMDELRDRDDDGLSDAIELDFGSDPTDDDSDNDGLNDAKEFEFGSNPNDDDSDDDGVSDSFDSCIIGDVGWLSSNTTDHDFDGCRDINEDNDDDNDGYLDWHDSCPRGMIAWSEMLSNSIDNDFDGCHDQIEDDDDDNDGWLDSVEVECGSNPLSALNIPLDSDNDHLCNLFDLDNDNDGIPDTYDAFPFDSSEWTDTDSDGIGNNADTDDDGDGWVDTAEIECGKHPTDFSSTPSDYDGDLICNYLDNDDDNDGFNDDLDVNDYADTGIRITLESFRVIDMMDSLDSEAEVYFCLYIDQIMEGCAPDGDYMWPMETGIQYMLNFEFFVDLPEHIGSHEIAIVAYDEDAFTTDDYIDINQDQSLDYYLFNFDSTNNSSNSTITTSGVGDEVGWDGELTFSYELVNLRERRNNNMNWEYNNEQYSIQITLDYDTYIQYKKLDKTVDFDDVSTYARFATPDASYIISLANQLDDYAISEGYLSDLERANFILAFVGEIQYKYDPEGWDGDYPKYPIEILWEGAGDCEDATALYISLMEALSFDVIYVILEVKTSADDEWVGHAMPAIYIPNHQGGYFSPTSGSKSNIHFYYAEATAFIGVGEDTWYDMQNIRYYDVE